MASRDWDAGIRRGLRELNRIPGVRTRASCQGRFSPDERSTHADLAYVAFRSPVPIALEEHLLAALGDLAQVAPEAVYSRWPERNREFCFRLADAASRFRTERRPRSGEEWRVALRTVLEGIELAIRSESGERLDWCLDCGTAAGEPRHRRGCRLVPLLPEEAGRRLATFARFIANDPTPPDPRLREREGDRQVLERIERGDFGAAYRRAWQRFVADTARDLLAGEVRERIRELRRSGDTIDLFFQRGTVVFARSARPAPAA